MKIVCTKSYLKGLKRLKKEHKEKEIRIIDDTVRKLSDLKITTQKSNHKLKNPQGLRDIHITLDLILLYKYENDVLTLDLQLQLHDLVNHDKLGSALQKRRKVDK